MCTSTRICVSTDCTLSWRSEAYPLGCRRYGAGVHKSKNHHSNDMHVVTQQKHREEARCTLDSFTVHVLSFFIFFLPFLQNVDF